jgi:hypothetical protein
MAHALVHILGSRSGYTTLDATPALSAADRAELEVLGFGDIASSEAMAALETDASMVGRQLRSGRFAISRMLPGGTDDKGRPTTEIVSLVLDAQGYARAVGALELLAADPRVWRLARGAVARGCELPEQSAPASPRDLGVLRAFDVWTAARDRGALGVLHASDAASLLAMVGLLDAADRAACRWGVGVLSLSAPVDVCTLSPSTAAVGARPVLRAASGDAWLRPEMASVVEFVADQPMLPSSDALASAVRIDPALDRAPSTRRYQVVSEEPAAVRHGGASPRRNLTVIAALCAAASLALFVFTATMYARGGRAVNVEVVSSEGLADSAPQLPPTTDQSRDENLAASNGYARIDSDGEPPPQAASNSDMQKPEAVADPCAALSGVYEELFPDLDRDGLGAGKSRPVCVVNNALPVILEGVHYVRKSGDECPDTPGVFHQTAYYLDKDEDGLGDPSERELCCATSPPPLRVANAADTDDSRDDRIAESKKPRTEGGVGRESTSQVAGQTPKDLLQSKLVEFKQICDECSDLRNKIQALQSPTKKFEDYTSDLGALAAELRKEEQRILELQRWLSAMSPACSPDTPRRFVANLWPMKWTPDCPYNTEFAKVWRNVLEISVEIRRAIESARDFYLEAARKEGQSSTGVNDHNSSRLQRIVKNKFVQALRDGPSRLLKEADVEEELRLLKKALEP